MKKLLTICFLLASSFTVMSQNLDEDLQKLNDETSKTDRIGHKVYINFTSDEIRLNYSNRGVYAYKWDSVAGLAITKANRVYLAFNDETYEYVTPVSGVTPEKILDDLDSLIYQITGKYTRVFGVILKDADY